MMLFGLIASIVINFILIYAAYNSLKKIEILESAINNFYSRVSITLHTMRAIDERQMFERDDEVGETFNQLVDVVNELRPLLYGSIVDGETTSEDNVG